MTNKKKSEQLNLSRFIGAGVLIGLAVSVILYLFFPSTVLDWDLSNNMATKGYYSGRQGGIFVPGSASLLCGIAGGLLGLILFILLKNRKADSQH